MDLNRQSFPSHILLIVEEGLALTKDVGMNLFQKNVLMRRLENNTGGMTRLRCLVCRETVQTCTRCEINASPSVANQSSLI
jgi:hypothetical protein